MQALPVPATSGVVLARGGTNAHIEFRGFSVAEVAVSPLLAYGRFRENSASGRILGVVKLAASGTSTFVPKDPIICNGDLYFELVTGVSGAIEGAVYVD